MSPHHHERKKAFNRGTFLQVDGEKFDVSNIVHESTELIPDEVSVVIRRCTWAEHLYPRIDETEVEASSFDESSKEERSRQRTDSESLSSHDDDESESDASNSASSHDDESDSSSLSSAISSGRNAAEEFWNQHGASLASINWTPQLEEKAELLKQFAQSGGPAKLPGAVRVGNEHTASLSSPKKPSLNRAESTPGAVHINGSGMNYNSSSTEQMRRESQERWKPLPEDTKPSPRTSAILESSYARAAAVQPSFSMDSYFSDSSRVRGGQAWQQQEDDDDSWSSGQIKAASLAFESCEIAPPSEHRMVQVTHDLELPLHGANETTRALENGNVVTVVCVVCRATLRCISIAQYVLCPECKCLTPCEENHSATGGVGLGLLSTYDQSFRVGAS